MLASLAPFPFPGAPACLKPDADPVRIIQRRTDGRVLVSRDLPSFLRSASTELTVDFADLAETEKGAIVIEPRQCEPRRRTPRPSTSRRLRAR
jgi:hypothetical protein